ncbi:LOW QUALITY PROTEIN: ribonuclease Z, mitochondrial-like [Bacillus rossius redtenbacheri]|uniref:LOW QUALITY PROTEIN: ribonuclease Z, mitochondrial-like n=1 Tax=Bacillus rossius redtenbacheri TaxID=93214 RepID=UPI002FDE3CAD
MHFLTILIRRNFAVILRRPNCLLNHNLHNLLVEMPKEKKHTQELKKQRQKLKEKGQKYVPGTVCLQVLGSGAEGAPTSLYLFTDQSRYLFNVGEGTQRLAHEHKMKLSKLEHIFITTPVWENIGGLPGVALTIQDVGVPQITLHGPPGTNEIFSATRRFVILKDLSVRMAPCFEGECFEDTVMTVRYVPLRDGGTEQAGTRANGGQAEASATSCSSDDDVDYYAHERKRKKRRSPKEGSDSPGGKRLRPEVPAGRRAMCYACQLKPKPGALCLERCVERGVPPGPLLGRLKAGEDVQLPDGSVVRSADVCLPDDPGPVFLVVDCPGPELLDSLVSSPALARHQASAARAEDFAYLVVHFTPPGVMGDRRYQEWMERFSPSTRHLVLNASNACLGSAAVHRIQHKLHLLHPGVFPLLGDRSVPAAGQDPASPPPPAAVPLVPARTLCSVWLRPKRGTERQAELTLDPEGFVAETLAVEGFPEELARLREALRAGRERDPAPARPFPRLLFLGTGSCIPNKTRNTSGILLQASEDCNVLVDCGEGTHGQLVRFYGPRRADDALRRTRAVFVSHLHADHHIGLVGVLKGRRRALARAGDHQARPVYLVAPRQIMSWLDFYHRHFEPVLDDFRLIPNGDLVEGASGSEPVLARALEELGMRAVATAPVDHCPNAFGVAFTHRDGWKVTYSGDTRPCPTLEELGRGSDLLVHEATMEDELAEEARLKLHSTTSQAVGVGRRMGACFTLLTHFSQRYAKLPRFEPGPAAAVGIAFDNMQVGLDDLSVLPLLLPALKLMFAEHCEELEQKAARRVMRRELEAAVKS